MKVRNCSERLLIRDIFTNNSSYIYLYKVQNSCNYLIVQVLLFLYVNCKVDMQNPYPQRLTSDESTKSLYWITRIFIRHANDSVYLFVCLFAVSHQSRDHHYRRRASNFVLYSALMTIEHWAFLSVPHLLWHGISVYNSHIWGPMTLTPVVEHLAEELSLPDLTNKSVATVGRTPISRMRGERSTFES